MPRFCCCSRRTKVLFIGVSDIILGVAQLTAFAFAVILSKTEFRNWDPTSWTPNWESSGLGYDRPLWLSIFLVLIGGITVSAVTFRSNFSAIISTILRVFWVLYWIGMTIFFLLGILLYDGFSKDLCTSLAWILIPSVYALIQLYFIYAVLNFRRCEMKGDGELLEMSTSLSLEFTPLSATQPEF